MCDGAVALVAAQVCHARAQSPAPDDRFALVSSMTKIQRVPHFRDQLGHHLGVAAIAVAGQNNGLATQCFLTVVWSTEPDTPDRTIGVGEKVRHPRVRNDRYLERFGAAVQGADQLLAGLRWRAVHAVAAVAGIEEAVDDVQAQPMDVVQPIDAYSRLATKGGDHGRIIFLVRFVDDIRRHLIGAVVEPLGLLDFGSGSWD